MNIQKHSFQWRAMTTSFVALSFFLLLASGLVLFLAPPGRVANWTNWSVLGLLKAEWTGLHIWFSAVFLFAVGFHLLFNWRPLVSYFKDRLTRRVGFRPEWIAATAACAVVAAGTLSGVPPFSSLLAWNEALKESWDRPAARAPIPHAELLTLGELAEKGGATPAAALVRLEARGLKDISADTVVAKIAATAGLSAQQVYEIIVPPVAVAATGEGTTEAGRAGGGPGWKTLTQFCADEGIPLGDALARLSAKGFSVEDGLTLRELAVKNGFQKPYELLEIIRGAPAG
jgi:hypothetical protein